MSRGFGRWVHRKIIARGPLNFRLFYDLTGDIAALRVHVMNGDDVNTPNEDRRTALHCAAAEGKRKGMLFISSFGGVDTLCVRRINARG